MREANDRVNSFGLADIDRVRRPVGHAYAELAHQARAGTTRTCCATRRRPPDFGGSGRPARPVARVNGL